VRVVSSQWSRVSKRICWVALGTLFFGLCLSAGAQQSAKIPRIGYVSNRVKPSPDSPDSGEAAFRQGLRDVGYADGKNIFIEHRYAEGKEDRLPELVAELIQLRVDVIVSATIRGIRAAKQATKTIPIIMVTTADPVAAGFVESLARPGGNVTGLTRLTRDLSGKRLELLKESIPKVSRVGVLWDSSGQAGQATDSGFRSYEAAARAH
jgi:putative ABC transport system substrate-binding protein